MEAAALMEAANFALGPGTAGFFAGLTTVRRPPSVRRPVMVSRTVGLPEVGGIGAVPAPNLGEDGGDGPPSRSCANCLIVRMLLAW